MGMVSFNHHLQSENLYSSILISLLKHPFCEDQGIPPSSISVPHKG